MLNSITIMGRMTRDPELRRTQNGTAVTSFTLAVERDYGKDGNGNKETDFIDCVAWRQAGEFVDKYFYKGQPAAVTGSLQSRKWTDKSGQQRTSWEVNVDHVYFAGGEKRVEEHADLSSREDAFEVCDSDDGDLPF